MDEEYATEERVDILWERICALEIMLTAALAMLVAVDKEAGERLEALMKELQDGETPENVTMLFKSPDAEVKDAVASLLVRTSKMLHPPLKVPPAVEERARRREQD